MTSERIARLFNATFAARYATVMIGGAAEPLYLPRDGTSPARIFYTRDFPASVLHEAAHWCVAGSARRALVDYGYTYAPPPRSHEDRAAFFAAERDVQALECVFARCAGLEFSISADDFGVTVGEREAFALVVAARSIERARHLSGRAAAFAAVLNAAAGSGGAALRAKS